MIVEALMTYGILTSQGNSATAQFIADQIRKGRSQLRESQVLGLHGKGILTDLYQVYEECRQPDWDGYGALPLDDKTFDLAQELIDAFPLGTPRPSFGAEPDGHLTLEWHHSLRRTLSVSISPDGELHYAAMLGSNKAYGTEVFYGEAPKKIVDLIHEVMPA